VRAPSSCRQGDGSSARDRISWEPQGVDDGRAGGCARTGKGGLQPLTGGDHHRSRRESDSWSLGAIGGERRCRRPNVQWAVPEARADTTGLTDSGLINLSM
jgi:hypothetical protein